MNIIKSVLHGTWDGWTPVELNDEQRVSNVSFMPMHNAPVTVAYFVCESGPFIGTSRYTNRDWEMHYDNPNVYVYAWRELPIAPKAEIVGVY